jgi:hypothetical protein
MNILFFTPGNIAPPMQEIELEIMQQHLDQGHTVTALMCKSELPSCWVNPTHRKVQCMYCQSKLKNGYSLLSKKIEILNMYTLTNDQKSFIANFKITASSNDELKKIFVDGFDLGWALLSTLISEERNPYPDISRHGQLLTTWAKTALITFFSIRNILKVKKYDLAYLYNGRTKDSRGILRAVQQSETSLKTYNTGGVFNTFGIFDNTFIHDINRTEESIIKFWNETSDESYKESVAKEFYENRIKGKVTIGPVFTALMKPGELPSGFNKNKKNISIFISSEDENVAIGDFWKFPFYSDQLDALQQIAKSIELFPESQYDFYIRIHPNLKNINNPYTNKIIGFNHPRFNVILPESTVNSYALIQNSDKVLTFCSTIAAEATFLEKPSIEAGKSFFMNLGSNYLPKDHNDLIKLLKIENLPALPKKGIYMYAYWWVKYGRTARRITDLSGKEVKYNGIKIKGNWLLEGMKWLQRKLK